MMQETDRKARLVEAVRILVEQRGDPAHFDPSAWVDAWILQPNLALGGRRPSALLDSDDGCTLLIRLLDQSANGVAL